MKQPELERVLQQAIELAYIRVRDGNVFIKNDSLGPITPDRCQELFEYLQDYIPNTSSMITFGDKVYSNTNGRYGKYITISENNTVLLLHLDGTLGYYPLHTIVRGSK